MTSLDELVDDLQPDSWRKTNPFSPEIEDAHDILLDPTQTRAEKANVLSFWLKKYQPCIFGRIAAQKKQISYCVLTDSDIAKGDNYVRDLIQQTRFNWRNEAYSGLKHGFVILLASKKVAYAEPSEALKAVALRLCQLYLSTQVTTDQIFLDELILDSYVQGNGTEALKWKVGANFFGTQADRRWWHDHRIPGGIALSMNSVGHMARRMVNEAISKNDTLAKAVSALPNEKLVDWALPTAMRTIYTASRGKLPGTKLAERGKTPLPDGISEEKRAEILKEFCPYSEDYYWGRYHTDVTIPSEYFNLGLKVPPADKEKLCFTYLHRRSDEDYESMGTGETLKDPESYLSMELETSILDTLGLSGFSEFGKL